MPGSSAGYGPAGNRLKGRDAEMAKDMSSTLRDLVTEKARDAIKNLGDASPNGKKSRSRLAGPTGIAAGAGLAAAVPLAKKGVDVVRSGAIATPPKKILGTAASRAG